MGVTEPGEAETAGENAARGDAVGGGHHGEVDLLEDLKHIEEQMKDLLKEKEQAHNK